MQIQPLKCFEIERDADWDGFLPDFEMARRGMERYGFRYQNAAFLQKSLTRVLHDGDDIFVIAEIADRLAYHDVKFPFEPDLKRISADRFDTVRYAVLGGKYFAHAGQKLVHVDGDDALGSHFRRRDRPDPDSRTDIENSRPGCHIPFQRFIKSAVSHRVAQQCLVRFQQPVSMIV